jgi:cytochrome c-type biogenesis protein CcmE
MTRQMKNRLLGTGAVVVALSGLGMISMGNLGNNLVYYWSPTELVQAANNHDVTVRLGGMVVPGTVQWNEQTQKVDFQVTDGKETVAVHSDGNPPQMFREGIGVVVEGKYSADNVFHCDRVMVKHSNEYQAPTDGHLPPEATLIEGAQR